MKRRSFIAFIACAAASALCNKGGGNASVCRIDA